jgi:hypothetical protein
VEGVTFSVNSLENVDVFNIFFSLENNFCCQVFSQILAAEGMIVIFYSLFVLFQWWTNCLIFKFNLFSKIVGCTSLFLYFLFQEVQG